MYTRNVESRQLIILYNSLATKLLLQQFSFINFIHKFNFKPKMDFIIIGFWILLDFSQTETPFLRY